MRDKKERFALPIVPVWPSQAPPPTPTTKSNGALLDAATNSQPIVQSLAMSATLESTGTANETHISRPMQQNTATALHTVPTATTALPLATKPKSTAKATPEKQPDFKSFIALLQMEHPTFAEEAAAVARTDVLNDFELNRYMTDEGSAHIVFHPEFTDPIELQFRKEMNALHSAEFRYFTVNFDIKRVTKVMVRFGQGYYTNIMIFKVFKGAEKPRLIAVELFDSPAMTFVKVRWATAWHRLSAFLDTMVNDVPDREKLLKYWERVALQKAKTTISDKLPIELRRAVYRHALLPSENNIAHPYMYSKARRRSPFRYRHKRTSQHNLNVLLLNKKLGGEAEQVLYNSANFTFLNVRTLCRFFDRILKKHANRIRKITLDFPCEEFEKLMTSTASKGLGRRVGGIEIIDSITNQLIQLTIRIQDPSTICPEHGGREYDCHTAAVQWVLERLIVLLPDLSSAKLDIEGLIKDAQKTRFMQYMKDAEKGQVEWRYPDEIQTWPYACRCIHRCDWRHCADFEQHMKVDDDLALGEIVFRQMKLVDGVLVAAGVDSEDLEDEEKDENEETGGDEETAEKEEKWTGSHGWW